MVRPIGAVKLKIDAATLSFPVTETGGLGSRRTAELHWLGKSLRGRPGRRGRRLPTGR
jgi:hypothetical protein